MDTHPPVSKRPGIVSGISAFLWLQAIALLTIFVLANIIYKQSGMVLVAANPVVSLGSAALLIFTGIVLWRMKKWGIFLFASVGVLTVLGTMRQTGLFSDNRTENMDLAALALVGFSYFSMGVELWREMIQDHKTLK